MSEMAYSTKLAIQRTIMAADRTLMAWIRTALSMISFGFTIYKVIQGFQEVENVLRPGIDGQRAGLILSGLGTVCIAVGMLEYFMTLHEVRKNFEVTHWRFSLLIAFAVLLIGIAIFVTIWNHFA
jgi:putative membrane protein